MATKTVLDVPVEFGGVSIGDATARLGLKILRANLTLETADECFCEHRLEVEVILGRNGDQSGQKTLMDDLEHRVSGSADVKRISASRETISTGLTFSLADVDVRELAKLSKGSGRVLVRGVGDIPAPEPKDTRPHEAPHVDGPWRDVPVHEVFAPGQANALEDFHISTLGEYVDYQRSKGVHWYEAIPRIGATVAQKMEDALAAFWQSNLQEEDSEE